MSLLVGSAAAAVSVGSGSYADSLLAGLPAPQAAAFRTANVAGPLPTNDWWTSVLASTTPCRMFAFPLAFRCDNGVNSGLLIGHPTISASANTVTTDDAFIQQLLVQGVYSGSNVITSSAVWVDGYSDWTVTPLWKDKNDPSKYYKTTFGHGLVFTYFDFAAGVSPRIVFPWDWHTVGKFNVFDSTGNPISEGSTFTSDDHIIIEFERYDSSTKIYYGVFAPAGSTFILDNITDGYCHQIDIILPPGKTFLSIGLMSSRSDITFWNDHAYAFVTRSTVTWNVDAAKSSVATTYTVTTEAKQGGQTVPILALLPHQYKHRRTTGDYLSPTFATLRGTMKLLAANSFTTADTFHGILPFLPDRGGYDRAHLKTLLDGDKSMSLDQAGTYWHGKELCKLANLIPIANQLGETATRDALVAKLKTDLINWYTCTGSETNKFFYYNSAWGSLIGYTPEYGLENFTDQHFHFGYFVSASAMLALYDADFAAKYGGMVELLIRSYASPSRSDTMFPFLRTFDPYEGHSWADGRGMSDSGNNQESSSEAMNAWAGIYLWGLATGNTSYRDLGIWGYTTEYAAIREYYFNIDGTQYPSGYGHNTVGILWGGKADYGTWFSGNVSENVHGIQLLPLTAPLLYPGYDTAYAKTNYDQMVAENGGTITSWQDTFWKFRALFNASGALGQYNESTALDSSNSRTFTYHWLHNFNTIGTVDTSVYADAPAYGVFVSSGTGKKLYVSLNPSDVKTTVTFRKAVDNSAVGSMDVPAHAMASTYDFASYSVDALIPSSATVTSSSDTTVVYAAPGWSVSVAIPAGAFAQNVTVSIAPAAVLPSPRASVGTSSIGFQVTVSPDIQPVRDITLAVTYTAGEVAGLDTAKLAIGRYDEDNSVWLPIASIVSPSQNKVVARTSHLSRFAVLALGAAQDLHSAVVYPNPYRPGSGGAFDRAGGIVFSNLTDPSRIRVYTVTGEIIFDHDVTDGSGRFEWDTMNSHDQKVASGIYPYIITGRSGEKKTGKIAIIR